MRIVCEKTLARFRGAGVCSWCKRHVSRREPHHVATRGHGSGGRLDLDINLVALCAVFSGGLDCHASHHAGHQPTTDDLLAVVAARERTTQDEIRRAVRDIRRLPKEAPRSAVEALLPAKAGRRPGGNKGA